MTNFDIPREEIAISEAQKNIEKYTPAIREIVAEYVRQQKEAENGNGKPPKGMSLDSPTREAMQAVVDDTFEIKAVNVNKLLQEPRVQVYIATNVDLVIEGEWAQKIIDQAGQ